ncbi:MAG: molybdenum cofactor biosynthesis protein MoaE [Thermoguttaceae bacterium]|nr:molybdenum cofactor biosynthesis protein MoaE [Thermoguttaceae bacterium]MDW8036606.1 molybdenum cofactor biosynthesis protein MoaE [Thermoguttaceae bacterium]
MIYFTQQPIDVPTVLESVASAEAGAVVLFLGTVRATSQGKTVAYLEYECYPEMAQRILEQLAIEAQACWNLKGCCIVHRIGRVPVGQLSVAIACSAPHRAEAFQATQWLIDQLKFQVPIWKKECFTDGTYRWVSGPGPELLTSSPSGESG